MSVVARFYHGSSAKKIEHEPEVDWPPKYCKLVIFFARPVGEVGKAGASPYFASKSNGDDAAGVVTEEWAFCDSRRFGRVVLKAKHPLEEEPLCSMGGWPDILHVGLC